MASTRPSSTAQHMLRTTTTWIMAIARLAAIACVLTVLVAGSSLLRGSHAGRDDLLGKSFSMVSFSGIAAQDTGAAHPYLSKMHWFINSLGWEWLETTTEIDAAGYVFNQPIRALHTPAVLHDAANSLQRAGHITKNCQSAAETCIGLSSAFFDAFDSASSLVLTNGPAFVFYVLAIVLDIAVPTLYSCIGLFRVGGGENRLPSLKTGLMTLPAVFHLIAASVLTSNASSLVSYLNQFPNVPSDAAVGRPFLTVVWCGFAAEVAASVAGIVRAFQMRHSSRDNDLEAGAAREAVLLIPRKPADQD